MWLRRLLQIIDDGYRYRVDTSRAGMRIDEEQALFSQWPTAHRRMYSRLLVAERRKGLGEATRRRDELQAAVDRCGEAGPDAAQLEAQLRGAEDAVRAAAAALDEASAAHTSEFGVDEQL